MRAKKSVKPSVKLSVKPSVKPAKKVYKVAPKYLGGSGQTWAGRGRQPLWVVEHLRKGGSLEDLLIK